METMTTAVAAARRADIVPTAADLSLRGGSKAAASLYPHSKRDPANRRESTKTPTSGPFAGRESRLFQNGSSVLKGLIAEAEERLDRLERGTDDNHAPD